MIGRPLMRTTGDRYSCVFVILALGIVLPHLAAPGRGAARPRDPKVRQAMEAALDHARKGGREELAEAARRMRALPQDEVVAILVDWLGDAEFARDEASRVFAYEALSSQRGAETEAGYRQLLVGLSDPTVEDICAHALTKSPSDRLVEVQRSLQSRLADPTLDWDRKPKLIAAIAELGPAASTLLPEMDRLFLTATETDPPIEPEPARDPVRSAASAALLRIGGIMHALDVYEVVEDPLGKRIALADLTRHFSSLNLGRDWEPVPHDERASRGRAEKLVIKAVRDPDKSVRLAAINAITPVFGGDLVVGEGVSGLQIHPEYRVVVENLAKYDPDPSLRRQAQNMLDEFELWVQKVERRRGNESPTSKQPNHP